MTKVLLVTPDSSKIPTFGYSCKKGFMENGCEVKTFDYRKLQLHRFSITNKALNQLLLKTALDYNPDLVFVVKGEKILPKIIEKISNSGIKTANWLMDDPFGTYSKYNMIKNITEYDYFMTFDQWYVKKLKEAGQPNGYFLPVCADPKLHKEITPLQKRKYKYNVSFVGTYHESRQKMLEYLSKYNPKIWGYHWNKVDHDSSIFSGIQKKIYKSNRVLKNTMKTNEIYNNSKINFNLHHPHTKNGVNMRTFEVPATNSFLLTDYYKVMSDLFTKKELIFYKNPDEIPELIEFFLENKDERDKVTKAGQKRVLKDHTYKQRMKELLRITLG